jgi:hypothetical protein
VLDESLSTAPFSQTMQTTHFDQVPQAGASCVCSERSRSNSDRARVENALCRSIRVTANGAHDVRTVFWRTTGASYTRNTVAACTNTTTIGAIRVRVGAATSWRRSTNEHDPRRRADHVKECVGRGEYRESNVIGQRRDPLLWSASPVTVGGRSNPATAGETAGAPSRVGLIGRLVVCYHTRLGFGPLAQIGQSAWFAISCWLTSEPLTTQTNRGLRSRLWAPIGSLLVHSPSGFGVAPAPLDRSAEGPGFKCGRSDHRLRSSRAGPSASGSVASPRSNLSRYSYPCRRCLT